MEGIQDCLDETLRILDSGETLSGYDSRVIFVICYAVLAEWVPHQKKEK